ncbi:clumping factor A-like isoform X3 [Scylla paramamosain]|uniref:clumping factor A-like isoform X3 n=1 Tax=Scylla paramamosain TaxID=85552 RepID=UPI0030839827
MTSMQVITCVAVVSVVVCGVTRATLVPYTLGKTTIMVDSEVLGYNSPLLSYLRQGMPLRRNGESHTDDILEDAGQPEETTYEEMPTTITQESDESYSFNKDFHTSPEGALAIKVMPEKRPPPITMNEAAGIYFKGQLIPIPHEDTIPPLYYNVQTPNFAQVSEKIHNIVTSLSPKLNDRAPDPSRPPPIPNALPLQLHARPGDTPPSLANTEGFTGVSVKHMVPEESDEDQATNNDDLNFLLSNDPEAVHHLLQSDIRDIHTKPLGHDNISPMGHIWGPAVDSLHHTNVHDDEETESNDKHTSLFGVMVEPLHHKSDPSSSTQHDGDELVVTLTDSGADEVSTIDTVTTLPAPVTQVSLHNTQSATEDSSAAFPHAVPTLAPEVIDVIANEEVDTVTIPANETESVSRQAEWMDTTDKVDAVIIPTEEVDLVTLTEELGTAILPIKKVNTGVPIEEVETVTLSVEEVETISYMTRTDIMPTEEYADIDLDKILSIKVDELQRDEVRETVLLAEEEEDQAALDSVMTNLFESLFGNVTDSPYSDSEDDISTSLVSTNGNVSDPLRQDEGYEQYAEERLNNNTLRIDDTANMDSAIKMNEDSHIDNSGFPAFPTVTLHTSEEQRPSRPHLLSGDDSLKPFSDFNEKTSFADRRTESASSGSGFPAQDQLHYSVDANSSSSGNNPEQQSSTQQDTSLKHDLPHSTDEGLKSWFNREPITIFDPLHSPNPGSSLPHEPQGSQLTPDSFATKLDYEDEDDRDSQPVSQQSGMDLVISPHSDSDQPQIPIKDVTEASESDSDSNTLGLPVGYNSSETDGDDNSANLTPKTGDDTGTPKDEDVNSSGDIFLDSYQSGTYEDAADLENSNKYDSDDSNTLKNDVNSDNPNTPKGDDDSDNSEILGDSYAMDDSKTDDSGAAEGDGDAGDSSTPKSDDDSDNSEILNDSDDMDNSKTPHDNDHSEAAEGDGDADDDDITEDGDNSDDTLRQAELSSSNASDTINTSTTASPNQTMSLVFPGAVVHNAGPEIFQKSACNCGLRFATKVVGGSPSSINENPWIVGLIDRSNFLFCAGTLITDRYIVTAAHCILNKEPFAVRVRLGVSRRNSPNPVEVDVKRLILHSKQREREETSAVGDCDQYLSKQLEMRDGKNLELDGKFGRVL